MDLLWNKEKKKQNNHRTSDHKATSSSTFMRAARKFRQSGDFRSISIPFWRAYRRPAI